MARDQLGITLDVDEVWASAASPSDRVAISPINTGYTSDYNNDKFPDRRHLNYVLAQLTAIGLDVNQFGAGLPWDTLILYEQYAWVTGSNGKIYRSVAAANIGNDPTSTSPSKWEELEEHILAIPDLKIDTEYVPITSHPIGISKSSVGTWSYTMADFIGAGLDIGEIRSLHIACQLHTSYDRGGDSYIAATYPADALPRIVYQNAQNIGDDSHIYGNHIIQIPINKATTSVTIALAFVTLGTGSGSFNIIGATQRTTV